MNAHGFASQIGNKKRTLNINNAFSSWKYIIIYLVHQGSIVEPILFKTFAADLFPVIDVTDLANYVDVTQSTIVMTVLIL